MSLKITKAPDGYWINRTDGTKLCGPYAHRHEAEDDLRGLARWYEARKAEANRKGR
jgi:hypothetical protein